MAPAPSAPAAGSVVRAYVGLGSNLGNRLRHLRDAVSALHDPPAVTVLRCSKVNESAAWGRTRQPPFLNAVVEVELATSARDLLRRALAIEATQERERLERWGPRTLDIDLLVVGKTHQTEDSSLVLPHPHIAGRRFVLVGLAELAPDLRMPGHEQTVAELLQRCPDTGFVEAITQVLVSPEAR